MEQQQALNRKLDAIGWGAFFVWWGVTELFPSLPEGVGAIGIGLILLALNAVRSRNGIPTSGFTTTLGILALVLGGLELAQVALDLPFELPVFGILLIVLGLIILGRELTGNRSESACSL
jgi:hypothetical protein